MTDVSGYRINITTDALEELSHKVSIDIQGRRVVKEILDCLNGPLLAKSRVECIRHCEKSHMPFLSIKKESRAVAMGSASQEHPEFSQEVRIGKNPVKIVNISANDVEHNLLSFDG